MYGDFPSSQLTVDRIRYSLDPSTRMLQHTEPPEGSEGGSNDEELECGVLQLELEAESVKFLSEQLESNQKKSLEVEQQTRKRT